MQPRRATRDDADEIVRLAGLMYASMGLDPDAADWRAQGHRFLDEHLGRDAVAVVVDDPAARGRSLIASAVGLVVQRLPTPRAPSGRFGYLGWVCTEPAYRRRGLARAVTDGLLDWFACPAAGRVELHATAAGEPVYLAAGFDPSPFPHLIWRPGRSRPAPASPGADGDR